MGGVASESEGKISNSLGLSQVLEHKPVTGVIVNQYGHGQYQKIASATKSVGDRFVKS
jgi:hypothetical protein